MPRGEGTGKRRGGTCEPDSADGSLNPAKRRLRSMSVTWPDPASDTNRLPETGSMAIE
jgi:hypothetical protein